MLVAEGSRSITQDDAETPPQYATGDSAPVYEPETAQQAVQVDFGSGPFGDDEEGGLQDDSSLPPSFAEAAILGGSTTSSPRSMTPDPGFDPPSYQAATVLSDPTDFELERLGAAQEVTSF
jgi:hypothetical protein